MGGQASPAPPPAHPGRGQLQVKLLINLCISYGRFDGCLILFRITTGTTCKIDNDMQPMISFHLMCLLDDVQSNTVPLPAKLFAQALWPERGLDWT